VLGPERLTVRLDHPAALGRSTIVHRDGVRVETLRDELAGHLVGAAA
jgi:hypothetical protein